MAMRPARVHPNAHDAISRRHRARAVIDLGEQDPLDHDGARQHRRGHVDHRRGVAVAGHEHLRVRRDHEGRRCRHVQGGQDRCHHRRGGGAGRLAAQPGRHDAGRAGDRIVRSAADRRRDGRVVRARQRHVRRRNARGHPGARRLGRLRGIQRVHRRLRAPSDPNGDRARAQRGAARLGNRRQAVQGPQSGRAHHSGQWGPLQRDGRQREEGLGLRSVAGRVRDGAAWCVSAAVRLAPVARYHGEADHARAGSAGDGRRAGRVAREAPPASARDRQLRHVYVRHADGPVEDLFAGRLHDPRWASSRCRWSSAALSS